MTGKRNTREPGWRPLAQKLTGLISRRSSGKARKTLDATDETPSHQQGDFPEEGASKFKPLEVQSGALEALRLPDDWLDKATETTKHGRTYQPPQAASASSTPIADLFPSLPVYEKSSTAERPSLPYYAEDNTRRPYSMVEMVGTAKDPHAWGPVDTASYLSTDVLSINSILERGRPVERRHVVIEPARVVKPLRPVLSPEDDAAAAHKPTTLEYLRHAELHQSNLSKPKSPEPNAYHQSIPGIPRTVAGAKDHSRREVVATTSANTAAIKAKLSPTPTPVPTAMASRRTSTASVDRVHAWQKRSISAGPSSMPPSVSGKSTAPSQPISVGRSASTRGGVTSNRLAWIRELEEKKKTSADRDLALLQKKGGSVSDKLAMFENKQALGAPSARLPPLTRTNSTSRFSAAGLESIFSADSNAASASPRTSIDTVRTNNRASSVMSYYDDSFREKLENLMGGQGPEKEKSNPSEKSVPTEKPSPPEESAPQDKAISPEQSTLKKSNSPEELIPQEKPNPPNESSLLEKPGPAETSIPQEKPHPPEELNPQEKLSPPEEFTLEKPSLPEEPLSQEQPNHPEELMSQEKPNPPKELTPLEKSSPPESPGLSENPNPSEESTLPEMPTLPEKSIPLEKPTPLVEHSPSEEFIHPEKSSPPEDSKSSGQSTSPEKSSPPRKEQPSVALAMPEPGVEEPTVQ